MNRRLSDYLKTLLLVVVILQFLPPLFKNFKNYFITNLEAKTKVGVVPIKNMIMDSSDHIKHLKKFFKDPEIKAIVLNIDSPGGTPGAAQALFGEILALKKKHTKPVVAFSENVCASAAYYIACATDAIVMQPATVMGSIGSYIAFPTIEGLMNQLQIKYNIIKAGSNKTAGVIFKDITPEQQAMLQSVTDDSYMQFLADVKATRPKLADKDPKQWAEGTVFTGRQGLELGLVDELGSQSVLEQVLKAKGAPIQGDVLWVHPPKPSAFAKLFSREEDDANESLSVTMNSGSLVSMLTQAFSSYLYA